MTSVSATALHGDCVELDAEAETAEEASPDDEAEEADGDETDGNGCLPSGNSTQ